MLLSDPSFVSNRASIENSHSCHGNESVFARCEFYDTGTPACLHTGMLGSLAVDPTTKHHALYLARSLFDVVEHAPDVNPHVIRRLVAAENQRAQYAVCEQESVRTD